MKAIVQSATLEAGRIIVTLVTDFDNTHEVISLLGSEIELSPPIEAEIKVGDWVIDKDQRLWLISKVLPNGNYLAKVNPDSLIEETVQLSPKNVRLYERK